MFLVSKNYLFHAYAWLKLYNLEEKASDDDNDADDSELKKMASCLTLAALAVPIFSRGDSISSHANNTMNRNKEYARLLGYHFNPGRDSLMEQISSMNLFEICPTEIQTLFNILENGSKPMSMVKEVVPLVKWLRANDDYKKYADGIDELLVVRLLEQLSTVSYFHIYIYIDTYIHTYIFLYAYIYIYVFVYEDTLLELS